MGNLLDIIRGAHDVEKVIMDFESMLFLFINVVCLLVSVYFDL